MSTKAYNFRKRAPRQTLNSIGIPKTYIRALKTNQDAVAHLVGAWECHYASTVFISRMAYEIKI